VLAYTPCYKLEDLVGARIYYLHALADNNNWHSHKGGDSVLSMQSSYISKMLTINVNVDIESTVTK